MTELNLINDANFGATAFGAAQYVSYALNDAVTLNGRAEIYRGRQRVSSSPPFPATTTSSIQSYGFPATVLGAGPATYTEFTLGLTLQANLAAVSKYVSNFMIRPEIRYDRTLTNTRAYVDFTSRNQVTLATDVVIGF